MSLFVSPRRWIHGQLGPCLRRFHFVKDTSAATVPEYAIVVCVVLCAILSAGSVLRNRADSFYAKTVDELIVTGPESTPASPAAQNAEQPERVAGVWSRIGSPTAIVLIGAQITTIVLVTLLVLRKKTASPAKQVGTEFGKYFSEHANRMLRAMRQNVGGLSKFEMLVETAMCKDVVTLGRSAGIEEVRQAVDQSIHGAVFIVAGSGELQGMITRNDLAQGSGAKAMRIMSSIDTTLSPTLKVSAAIETVLQTDLGLVPVIRDQQLCGVLSHIELVGTLRAALQMLQEIEEQHRTALLRTVASEP